MSDYSYPSVYFSYFIFVLFAAGAVFFFIRSLKDGYLGPDSEEPKYRMLQDDSQGEAIHEPTGVGTPRRP